MGSNLYCFNVHSHPPQTKKKHHSFAQFEDYHMLIKLYHRLTLGDNNIIY